jgi:hypothetical protein
MPHTHPINDINDLGVVKVLIEYELVSASDHEDRASPSIAFALAGLQTTLTDQSDEYISSHHFLGMDRNPSRTTLSEHFLITLYTGSKKWKATIGTIRHKY